MTEPAPFVLLLAGLDPSGGAGLAQDLRSLEALGARGLPVPTCLTAQSRLGFHLLQEVRPDTLQAMLSAALEHVPPRSVKVGLLAGPRQVELLASLLPPGLPCVVDPVLGPTLTPLFSPELASAYRIHLAPRRVIFTPNRMELTHLAGLAKDARHEEAAAILLGAGARAVVLKGGHAPGAEVRDLLYLPSDPVQVFARPRLRVGEVHGTGCAFSAALAALLARSKPLSEAVEAAGAHVAGLLQRAFSLGPGLGQLG